MAGLDGILTGAGSVVDQAFAWLFALLALQLVLSMLGYLAKEVRLRRMYDRRGGTRRWARTVPPPDDGERPRGGGADRPL